MKSEVRKMAKKYTGVCVMLNIFGFQETFKKYKLFDLLKRQKVFDL